MTAAVIPGQERPYSGRRHSGRRHPERRWLRGRPGRKLLAAGLLFAVVGVGAGIVVGHAGFVVRVAALLAIPVVVVALPVFIARPRLAVAAVVVAMPFGANYVPGLGLKLIVVMCAIAVGAVVVGRTLHGRGPLPWPRLAWILLGLVAIAGISTATSVTPTDSVKQDLTFVLGALFSLAVVAVVSCPAQLRRMIGLFVIVGGAMCAQAIPSAQGLKSSFGGSIVDNRPVGVFSQPNELGGFSAAVLIAALALGLSARTRRARIGWTLVGTTAAISMAVSLSRGSLIGAALGVVGVVVLLPAHRRRIVLALAALTLAFLAVTASGTGPQQVQVVGERIRTLGGGKESPYDDRPAIWSEAFRQFSEQPLTGLGPGSFPVTSARSRPPGIFPEAVRRRTQDAPLLVGADHAHNVLLTFAAEQGGIAVALVVAFTVGLGLSIWRSSRRLHDPVLVGVTAAVGGALCTFIGQGAVDFTLHNPVLTTVVWFLVGLALAAGRRPVSERAARRSSGTTQ